MRWAVAVEEVRGVNVRPIDANALYDALRDNEFQTFCPLDEVDEVVAAAPAIDYAPVVHGEWVDRIDPFSTTATGKPVHEFRCSVCKFKWTNKRTVEEYFKYCPSCGAKMDGKENVC